MKVKVKSRRIVSELEEKMIKIMQTKIATCKTVDERNSLESYLRTMERRFVKTLKKNVEPMSIQELGDYLAKCPVEPLDVDLQKRISLLDQQILSSAKRIRNFREKYPKEIEKIFNDKTQLEQISKIREELKETIAPVESTKEVDTSIHDTLNKTINEIHRLVDTLPELTQQVSKIQEVERKRKLESPAKSPAPKKKK